MKSEQYCNIARTKCFGSLPLLGDSILPRAKCRTYLGLGMTMKMKGPKRSLEVESHGALRKKNIVGGSPETMLATEFRGWMAFILLWHDSASPKSRSQNQVHHSAQSSPSIDERRYMLIQPQRSTDARETSCLAIQAYNSWLLHSGAGSSQNRVPSTPPALARHRVMFCSATPKPTYLHVTGCV